MIRIFSSTVKLLSSVPVQNFGKTRAKVILIQDLPPLGFEGEEVTVKPGHASLDLVPKKKAVYSFPGLRKRMFPNFDEKLLARKRSDYDLKLFVRKLETVELKIVKPATPVNPLFLKDPITKKELTDEINIGLNLNVTQDNVVLDEDLYKFGKTAVLIKDYYSEKYDRHFSFRLQIDLIKMEIQAAVQKGKEKGEGKKKEKAPKEVEATNVEAKTEEKKPEEKKAEEKTEEKKGDAKKAAEKK
eukprot:CAMPEP_0176447506 /NCGR_PEP_ID=MMETSP0127-20121128/25086_1 /TAXON_ID=938130 /ORGANISM="Platyophrya macrostoma, Strain WH" /LENGTH=242 /DNA_ID=CAMNT_0017833993 /DNA_START=11 /DNA_END=739 /DNA_ORIENTATION=-